MAINLVPLQMITVPRMFNDFFENDFLGLRGEMQHCQEARADLIETEVEYKLKVDAPGCQKQNFEVELGKGNILRVGGKSEESH